MGKRKILMIVVGLVGLVIIYQLFVNPQRFFRFPIPAFPGSNSLTKQVSPRGISEVQNYPVSTEPSDIPPLPPGEVEKRLVIREANLSLVVKDLNQAKDKIVSFIESIQGYLVSSEMYGVEQNTRVTVIVRVPENKFNETLSMIRLLGTKVTSESISGQDVTEEYVDLQARLKSLEASRNRFKEILQSATTVDQILTIQREIDRVQMQIEQTTGRIEYLKKSATMSKITVNLALDEESLPYVPPSEKWKPLFVFKKAVRNLISLLKTLSYMVIWVVVFAVVWVPALLLFKFIKKKFSPKLPR